MTRQKSKSDDIPFTKVIRKSLERTLKSWRNLLVDIFCKLGIGSKICHKTRLPVISKDVGIIECQEPGNCLTIIDKIDLIKNKK